MARILLVDDEEDICTLLSNILNKEGFETTCALSLKDARDKLAKERFDSAFIDLNLPDGFGSHLIPLIKELDSATKVIIISAFDTGLTRAANEGADYLIKKPFSRTTVLSALNDLQLR